MVSQLKVVRYLIVALCVIGLRLSANARDWKEESGYSSTTLMAYESLDSGSMRYKFFLGGSAVANISGDHCYLNLLDGKKKNRSGTIWRDLAIAVDDVVCVDFLIAADNGKFDKAGCGYTLFMAKDPGGSKNYDVGCGGRGSDAGYRGMTTSCDPRLGAMIEFYNDDSARIYQGEKCTENHVASGSTYSWSHFHWMRFKYTQRDNTLRIQYVNSDGSIHAECTQKKMSGASVLRDYFHADHLYFGMGAGSDKKSLEYKCEGFRYYVYGEDRMADALEIDLGLNPDVNDENSDLDGDGLTNYQEYKKKDRAHFHPNKSDSDGDGWSDFCEYYGTPSDGLSVTQGTADIIKVALDVSYKTFKGVTKVELKAEALDSEASRLDDLRENSDYASGGENVPWHSVFSATSDASRSLNTVVQQASLSVWPDIKYRISIRYTTLGGVVRESSFFDIRSGKALNRIQFSSREAAVVNNESCSVSAADLCHVLALSQAKESGIVTSQTIISDSAGTTREDVGSGSSESQYSFSHNGTLTIKATAAAGSYTLGAEALLSVTVSKRGLVFTWDDEAGEEPNDFLSYLTYSGSDLNPAGYTVSPTQYIDAVTVGYTCAGSAVSAIHDAGTYTITPALADSDKYMFSQSPPVYTMVVNPSEANSITWLQYPSDNCDATGSYQLAAESVSGEAVTFAITTGGDIATVSEGNILTFSDTGSITVKASCAGNNANYNKPDDQYKMITSVAANAVLNIGNLEQTYDGAGQPLTVMLNETTDITGSSDLYFEYRSRPPVGSPPSAVHPVNAGSYDVFVYYDGGTIIGMTNAVLNVRKAVATVVFEPQDLVDTVYAPGVSHAVRAGSANPAGLNIAPLLYNGITDIPLNAASYQVIAAIDEQNYQGSATNSFEINRAPQTWDFVEQESSVAATDKISLPFQSSAGIEAQYEVLSGPALINNCVLSFAGEGDVSIRGTIPDQVPCNYVSLPAVTQLYHVAAQPVSILISGTNQIYNGEAKEVNVITQPNKACSVSYNGSTNPPVNAGLYSVVVTVVDPLYTGESEALMTIHKAQADITFPDPGTQSVTNQVVLLACSSSGLELVFNLISGPALLSDLSSGTVASFTATGLVSISAEVMETANYSGASAERSFDVVYASRPGCLPQFPALINLAGDMNSAGLTVYGRNFSGRNPEWGRDVIGIGDFNGDGFSDFALSSTRYSDSDAVDDSGAVAIIFGAGQQSVIDLNQSNAGVTCLFGSDGEQLGYALASGDFNGDLLMDLAIGAPGYAGGTGRVVIVYGDRNMPVSAELNFKGSVVEGFSWQAVEGTQDSSFGSALACGHLSLDTADDLVVGAPDCNVGRGAVYIWNNQGMLQALEGVNGRAEFGSSLALFDLGSAKMLAVGAPEYQSDNDAPDSGAVVLFKELPPNLDEVRFDHTHCRLFYCTNSLASAGISLVAGDLNGDGLPELAVGAAGMNGVYILPGLNLTNESVDVNLDCAEIIRLSGEPSGAGRFGSSLAIGDVTGDGLNDLAVADENIIYSCEGTTRRGAVYLFSGNTEGYLSTTSLNSFDGLNGFKIAAAASDTTGCSLDIADINNDRTPDLLFGCRNLLYDSVTSVGGMYAVYGENRQPRQGVITNITPEFVCGDDLLSQVRIEGAYLGTGGNDIKRVLLAGVEVDSIIDQGVDFVQSMPGENPEVVSGSVTVESFAYGLTELTNSFAYKHRPAVTFGNTNVSFNGEAHAVEITSVPDSVEFSLTYNGTPMLPVSAGIYDVIASVLSNNLYYGAFTTQLAIARANNVIVWEPLPAEVAFNEVLTPVASALYGDNVTFATFGPALLSDGILTFTATGEVAVVASTPVYNDYLANSSTQFISVVGALTNIAPERASLSGGTPVAIKGYGWDGSVTSVRLCGHAASIVTQGAEWVSVTTPALADTDYEHGAVEVTLSSGRTLRRENAFTFQDNRAEIYFDPDSLNAVYDGNGHSVLFHTDPSGLNCTVAYPAGVMPTNAGSYQVVASVDDVYYHGCSTGLLSVAKAAQTISFTLTTPQLTTATPVLEATASCFPVQFEIISGPAVMDGENTLVFNAAGDVVVKAYQNGTLNYHPVTATQSVTVVYAQRPQDTGGFPPAFNLEDVASGNVFVMLGTVDDERVGSSLAASDGKLLIAAPYATRNEQRRCGELYYVECSPLWRNVHRGWAIVSEIAEKSVAGEVALSYLGSDLACAGDLNGDDQSDWMAATSPSDDAVAYLFCSGAVSRVVNSGGGHEIQISEIGDWNGDGLNEFAVAWPAASGGRGSVYLFAGNSNGYSEVINASQDALWSYTGANTNSCAGRELCGGGDLNGDGINDLIFTSSSISLDYDSGTGAVCVVYGNSDTSQLPTQIVQLNGTNGCVISGNEAVDESDFVAAIVNDVDGDGCDELAIGSLTWDASPGQPNAGIAALIPGASLKGVRSAFYGDLPGAWILRGAQSEGQLGSAIAGIGDINNDGLGDIAVGAPAEGAPDKPGCGNLYVLLGNAENAFVGSTAKLDGNNGFVINGFRAQDAFGSAIAGNVDLDRDGVGDVVVSAPDASYLGTSQAGAVWVIFGRNRSESAGRISAVEPDSAPLAGETDVLISGEYLGAGADILSVSLCGVEASVVSQSVDWVMVRTAAGTTNQLGNVAVTSRSYGTLELTDSFVYGSLPLEIEVSATNQIYNGLPHQVDVSFNRGTLPYSVLYNNLTNQPVNAGVYDVRVEMLDSWFSQQSAASVLTIEKAQPVLAYNGWPSEAFTTSAVPVNVTSSSGVSVESVLIAGPGLLDNGVMRFTTTGCVSVAFSAQESANWFSLPPCTNLISVHYVPLPSVAPRYETDQCYTNFDISFYNNDQYFNSEQKGSYCISSLGDVTADGINDIAVGWPQYDHDKGRVYILSGARLIGRNHVNLESIESDEIGWVINGLYDNGAFGSAISGIGDFNADGIDDLCIGAPNVNDYNGAAFIIWGNVAGFDAVNVSCPRMDSCIMLTGVSEGELGFTITSGDLNGDAKADVCIGEPYFIDNNNQESGRVYVLYGGSASLSAPFMDIATGVNLCGGWFLQGCDEENLGSSIAVCGDLNGDNVCELIAGAAKGRSDSSDQHGAVYLRFGGNNVSISTDQLKANPELGVYYVGEKGQQIGAAVSAVDADADGIDDLLFGMPGYFDFSTWLTYDGGCLLFNGANAVKIAEHTVSGEALLMRVGSGASLGKALAGINDLNDDGVADILLGESDYSTDTEDGAVYILYGGRQSSGDQTIDLSAASPAPEKGFRITGRIDMSVGYSVASGDANNDLRDDILFAGESVEASDPNPLVGGVTFAMPSVEIDSPVITDITPATLTCDANRATAITITGYGICAGAQDLLSVTIAGKAMNVISQDVDTVVVDISNLTLSSNSRYLQVIINSLAYGEAVAADNLLYQSGLSGMAIIVF